MKIYVDFDGVIADLLPAWVWWLNNQHGTNVQAQDITAWEMDNFFPTLTAEQVYEPLHSGDIYGSVIPMRGAVSAMRHLSKLYRTYITTSCGSPDIIRQKQDWLRGWGLGEFAFGEYGQLARRLVVVKDKGRILNGNDAIMIDDHPRNFDGFQGYSILFDAPHNQEPDMKQLIWTRVGSWDDILTALRGRHDV